MDFDGIVIILLIILVPLLSRFLFAFEGIISFFWNFANLFAIAVVVVYFFFPDLIAPLFGETDEAVTSVLFTGIGIYIACSVRGIIRIKNNFDIEVTFMDKVMLILNIPCLVACFLFGFTLYEMFQGSGVSSEKSDKAVVTTDDIGREIITDGEGNKIDSVDSYDWDGNVRGTSGKKYTKK